MVRAAREKRAARPAAAAEAVSRLRGRFPGLDLCQLPLVNIDRTDSSESPHSIHGSAKPLGTPPLPQCMATGPAEQTVTTPEAATEAAAQTRARTRQSFTVGKRNIGRPPLHPQTFFLRDRKSTRLNSSHVSISYAV